MLQERSQWLRHWTTPRRHHQLTSTCAEQFRHRSTELLQISLEVPERGLQAMGEKILLEMQEELKKLFSKVTEQSVRPNCPQFRRTTSKCFRNNCSNGSPEDVRTF